uniref:hypothetical protein n=1 Tax=Amycolatopsis sp. CA-096443 TaxID=3239919 RepID=UPI003F496931
MLNPAKCRFAIGARLPDTALLVEWDAGGPGRHVLELDDLATHSYARLDADVTDPAPFTVRQIGPRRLWDEALDAHDWWHAHGKPRADRLGLTVADGAQTVFLDTPGNVVRTWPAAAGRTGPPA